MSMFEWVPVRVWLLIAIVAIGYAPTLYVYRHVLHAPSRRDITQPAEDLSWRTSGQLTLSLLVLAILAGLAVFIFTPAAVSFARSPILLPALLLGGGAWALFTVLQGFKRGEIEPIVRGFSGLYHRDSQPKRFWASVMWNALLGCILLWIAFKTTEEAEERTLRNRCYNEQSVFSPQEVLSACNELISKWEGSPGRLADYIGGRGIAYHTLGDYRRAIADYGDAIRLNPRDYYPYYNRGLAYRELRDNERAISDFSAAISFRPNDADAYMERGLLLLDTGRLNEAAADFTRAHELEPKDPWPLANRGITYAWKNEKVRAERDFEAVRAIDPSNQVLLRGEALLAINARDLNSAVSRLSEALSREPGDVWSRGMRADVYRQLGEYEKSRADAEQLAHLRNETKKAMPTSD